MSFLGLCLGIKKKALATLNGICILLACPCVLDYWTQWEGSRLSLLLGCLPWL